MTKVEELAEKLGLSVEQVSEIAASAKEVNAAVKAEVDGGTVETRVLFSEERLAARRAELASQR